MTYLIAFSRWLLPVLAVVLLVKCLMTLLLGRPTEKTYGYLIDLNDGEHYPLNMWETAIGRSTTNDVIIGYPTVSRSQAVISRRIDGWYVYDLRSKSGILINGKVCEGKAVIQDGDLLVFGNVRFRFSVANDPVIRVGKQKRQAAPATGTPLRTAPKPVPRPAVSPAPQPQRPPQPLFTPDEFYDESHRPQLNFQKPKPVPPYAPPPTDGVNVYSNVNREFVGMQHLQTPDRSNGRVIRAARPTLVNVATGARYILTGNTVSIGRSRSCDIQLTEPTVSRRHAMLVLYEDGWTITDNGSVHGTFLNGSQVTSPQLLFDGDKITLADAVLKYSG